MCVWYLKLGTFGGERGYIYCETSSKNKKLPITKGTLLTVKRRWGNRGRRFLD